jgi:U3 small nucleolar ribonucleoprotein protein LCP5
MMFFFRYEESYFTRLPTTKLERHRHRKVTTLGTLGEELTRFGDFRALEGGAGASGPSGASKKRKHSKGKKSKFHTTFKEFRFTVILLTFCFC